jgi:uncharacterized membrane protein YhaH (DUF805 family)
MHTTLTNAAWLTPERATAWCRVLAACQAVWLLALILRSHDPLLTHTDFACFWTASKLALQGKLAAVYDPFAMAAAEHRLHLFADNLVQPFLYPPSYLLLCLPLALLPLGVSAIAFLLAGLAPFLFCIGRLLPWRRYWLPILTFPGVMVTAGSGQNGFFTAACFGGGTLLLDRFPFCAGMCLGLLACKPHLAMLVPVALLAARRWRALAGAVTSALAVIAVSCAVLGIRVWLLFPGALGEARLVIDTLLEQGQLQSLFGGALLLQAPHWLALACQAFLSLAVLGLLIHVAARRPGGRAEGATLVVASLAASPYLMDYDLVILAVPLAWLFSEASRVGWRPWERRASI